MLFDFHGAADTFSPAAIVTGLMEIPLVPPPTPPRASLALNSMEESGSGPAPPMSAKPSEKDFWEYKELEVLML